MFPYMAVRLCGIRCKLMLGQFVFGEDVVHVLLMIDEASRFAVAHELYRHPKTEQRNPTF